jgi:hypothetical protein
MITELELKKVTEMVSERKKLNRIIDNFNSSIVKNRIGLIGISTSITNGYNIHENDMAEHIEKNYKSIMDSLNDKFIEEMKSEICKLDHEIEKYIE